MAGVVGVQPPAMPTPARTARATTAAAPRRAPRKLGLPIPARRQGTPGFDHGGPIDCHRGWAHDASPRRAASAGKRCRSRAAACARPPGHPRTASRAALNRPGEVVGIPCKCGGTGYEGWSCQNTQEVRFGVSGGCGPDRAGDREADRAGWRLGEGLETDPWGTAPVPHPTTIRRCPSRPTCSGTPAAAGPCINSVPAGSPTSLKPACHC